MKTSIRKKKYTDDSIAAKMNENKQTTVQYNKPEEPSAAKRDSLPGESPYKTPPSNNDLYPNTNYMQNMLDSEKAGDYNSAAYWERMRNEKIKNGYGGGYAPTSFYNYNSKYGDKIADLRDQYENYEDFTYNPLQDDAYKSLANVYSKNASDAAANALGQAAAANGGRMSSNALIASNLAYQNKMAGLEAEIPALRQAAYDMYLGGKNDLRTSLNDYMYQEQQDYARWENDLDRRINNQKYENEQNAQRYMNEILTFGKVVSPEAAKYFGVDIGTASHDALVNRRNYDLDASEFLGYVTPNVANDSGMYGLGYSPTLPREQYNYGKFTDARDYARSVYEDERNFARDVYEDERDFAKKSGGSSGGGSSGGGSSGGGSSSGGYSGGSVYYPPYEEPSGSDISDPILRGEADSRASAKKLTGYFPGQGYISVGEDIDRRFRNGELTEEEALKEMLRRAYY